MLSSFFMLKIEKKGGNDVSMYLFDEQPIVANKALDSVKIFSQIQFQPSDSW